MSKEASLAGMFISGTLIVFFVGVMTGEATAKETMVQEALRIAWDRGYKYQCEDEK